MNGHFVFYFQIRSCTPYFVEETSVLNVRYRKLELNCEAPMHRQLADGLHRNNRANYPPHQLNQNQLTQKLRIQCAIEYSYRNIC